MHVPSCNKNPETVDRSPPNKTLARSPMNHPHSASTSAMMPKIDTGKRSHDKSRVTIRDLSLPNYNIMPGRAAPTQRFS